MLERWPPLVVTAGAVIAVLIVMIGFWRFVIRFLSESSNWPELVTRFPTNDRPEGRVFGHQAATLHGVAHQGILRVIPSASGFYVEIERPFSYREPPLLIPWSAFRELKEYRSFFGWRQLRVGTVRGRSVPSLASRRGGGARALQRPPPSHARPNALADLRATPLAARLRLVRSVREA